MADYRSYRAPREDHSRLCVPELDQVAASIDENRNRLDTAKCDWMDVGLSTVRRWAREEALVQAEAYMHGYLPEACHAVRSDRESVSPAPIILSGHQPELFHPGVWFKNFLLASLAERHSAIGVHILIDHDLARTFSMHVPAMTRDGWLHKETLAIDDNRPVGPWEYAKAQDFNQWREFASAVVERLLSVGIANPLLAELWSSVIAALEQGKPLGEGLSAARHRVEHANGLRTLEVPFSRLASGRSFACFVGELLTRIEVVHETYNAARLAYRRYHLIKNHLQPLPALARDGDWFEAPFWVYSAADPVRRPVWVLRDGNQLRVSDRQQWQVDFPSNQNFEGWFRRWCEIKAANVAIRPRALTTTAYLRIAIADLFIHGIGGGKYDQMTDQIVDSLWGMRAPIYMVATATLHLPIGAADGASATKMPQAVGDTESDVLKRIRNWRFSPERLCGEARSNSALEKLIREKRMLLSRKRTGQEKPAWHEEVQQLNASIRQHLRDTEASLRAELEEAVNRERASAIRTTREFSLALFPSNTIIDPLKRLCRDGANSNGPEDCFGEA